MREANSLHGFQFRRTFCDVCRSEIHLAAPRHHCFDCHIDRCATCCALNGSDGHPETHAGAWYPGLAVGSDECRNASEMLIQEHDRVRLQLGDRQMTTFSSVVHDLITGSGRVQNLPPEGTAIARRTLDALATLRAMGRFVDFFARKTLSGSSVDPATFFMSGGVRDANRWRGVPLFKTAFDCALYPILLADLKPATIFELGSALGGSAAWFADLASIHGFECHVYSMDLAPPDVEHNGVTFLRGDSHRLTDTLSHELLARAPHPWLVVEDAHVEIGGVIAHFSRYMRPGDYLAIEDHDAESDVGKHLLAHPGSFLVDTHYTDYFGYNATCCRDQILCFHGNGPSPEVRRDDAARAVELLNQVDLSALSLEDVEKIDNASLKELIVGLVRSNHHETAAPRRKKTKQRARPLLSRPRTDAPAEIPTKKKKKKGKKKHKRRG